MPHSLSWAGAQVSTVTDTHGLSASHSVPNSDTNTLLPLTRMPTQITPTDLPAPVPVFTFVGIHLLPGTFSLLQRDIVYGNIPQVA